MSPTVFHDGKCRYYFFSREEMRPHIHVASPDGEAKFWIEPIVALAASTGFSPKKLRALQSTVEARRNEIKSRWKKHFQN
jgi:hypothetical protein